MSAPPPATIRTATLDDSAGLAVLATHLGYPADAAAMRGRLERLEGRDDYATFVAEREGRLVGFTGVMQAWSYTYDEPSVRLLALVVEPDERGRGTGAALVQAVERWAAQHGGSQVHLTTALHREDAHRFYDGLGYRRSGLRFVKTLG
jgi:GNAT superfamily N-acetyltransferase